MTPPDDPATADDLELVSAYLDGEATAAEAARVEGDDRLRALAGRLRATAARLAVDDPPPALVDDHVAAALEHFQEVPADAPVVDLSAERRRRWYDRVPLGAVAAVVLVVALIGAATQIDFDGGQDDTAATATDAAGETSSEGGGDGGQATLDAPVAGDAFGADADMSAGATALPVFGSADELAEHIRSEVLGTTERSATGGGSRAVDQSPPLSDAAEPEAEDDDAGTAASGYESGAACDAVSAAGVAGEPVVAVVPAVLAGRDVTAIVVDDDGSMRLLVVDDLDCVVVDDRTL